jgi:dienelactone hydrolase
MATFAKQLAASGIAHVPIVLAFAAAFPLLIPAWRRRDSATARWTKTTKPMANRLVTLISGSLFSLLSLLSLAACSSDGGTNGSPYATGGYGAGVTTGGTAANGGASGSGSGGVTANGGTSPAGGSGGATVTGGAGGATGGVPPATGGAPPGSGGAGTGGTPPNEPEVVSGCGSTKLYKNPDDVSQDGPWPVGVKTVQVSSGGSQMPVEIWYPATLGSSAGKTKEKYDVTKYLFTDASKIPPEQNKLPECNCYRDLPIDTAHGPYPAVIFIHGTGSFRVASASTMSRWASRGFIVLAADHWGLYLSDFIACPGKPAGPVQDLNRDVDAMLAAMNAKSGDFSFLGSSIDLTRLAISGHSQGGQAAGSMGNKANVQVVLPFSQLGSAAVTKSAATKSAMFVCGKNDSVTQFSSSSAGYTASTTAKKRLVGITGADHLDVTDLCVEKNNQGKYAIQVALDNNVCGPLLAVLAGLAKCGTMPDSTKGPAITNYASAAALEETLHCQDRSAAFSSLKTKYPEVSDFLQSP